MFVAYTVWQCSTNHDETTYLSVSKLYLLKTYEKNNSQVSNYLYSLVDVSLNLNLEIILHVEEYSEKNRRNFLYVIVSFVERETC